MTKQNHLKNLTSTKYKHDKKIEITLKTQKNNMTEKDKQLLIGKKCKINIYFTKLKILKTLNSLIDEAHQILETYKEVSFENAYETAYFQTNPLYIKETTWSNAVEKALLDLFGNQQSDVSIQIRNVIEQNDLHLYAKTRKTLEKKREILRQFSNDINEL